MTTISRRRGPRAGRGQGTSSPVVLSAAEQARFWRDGFLILDRTVVEEADLAPVRAIIDRLYARFDQLPPELAYDLGEVKHHAKPREIPEINALTRIEPGLLDTVAYARCHELARQLLGRRARWVHDHVIRKPPRSPATIEWHQDLAFAPGNPTTRQVHIWLALQDVTEENGCVRYLPQAGAPRLLPHHRRGPESHALVATGVDGSAAVACPIAAGMATIHRVTTLHSSGPNTTDEPRMAWTLIFRDPGPPWSPTRIWRVLTRIWRPLLGRRRRHRVS